jgi:hypothetical protein
MSKIRMKDKPAQAELERGTLQGKMNVMFLPSAQLVS